jgi:hypothetical protein
LQAALMFTVITKLDDYPADPDLAQLAKNAILEMADRLLLEQPYQSVKAGPFQSETIGSYSYSRTTQTISKVQQGLRTGLFWWDLAIAELSVASANTVEHGAVNVIPDGLRRDEVGNWVVRNAAETDDPDWPPYVRIS